MTSSKRHPLLPIRPMTRPILVPDVVRVFAPFGPVYLGPGFRVRRAVAYDEPLAVVYEIVLWNTLKFYAVIVPTETVGGL